MESLLHRCAERRDGLYVYSAYMASTFDVRNEVEESESTQGALLTWR